MYPYLIYCNHVWGLACNTHLDSLIKLQKGQLELEQLEHLRSEDTPPTPHDYPYYWPVHFESQVHTNDQFISDPKSKQGECQKISEKFKF